MITRRALLAGAAAALPAASPRPQLAAQLYVWSQFFARQSKTLSEGLAEAFASTRRAGFRQVEFDIELFREDRRENTIAGLKEHGLSAPIVYSGGKFHESATARRAINSILDAADALKAAGVRMVNVNPFPKQRKEEKTDAELDVQAGYVRRLDAELQNRGLRLILHHHDAEMAGDAREWRHLLANTKTALCVDTDWALRGGQNPLEILKAAGERLASVHLRSSGRGVWSEDFGEGDIDYRAVAAYLRRRRYSGYLVVELAYEKGTKITRGLEDDLRRSREYAERTFGVKA